jgi:hypothetical protein
MGTAEKAKTNLSHEVKKYSNEIKSTEKFYEYHKNNMEDGTRSAQKYILININFFTFAGHFIVTWRYLKFIHMNLK